MSKQPPPSAPCPLCGSLADVSTARQKWGWEEHDTHLPEAVRHFELVRDLAPESQRARLVLGCPACGAHYLYTSDYEYLANGSEDEQRLERLSEDDARALLA